MTIHSLTKNIDLSQIDFNDKEASSKLAAQILEEMQRDGKSFAEVVGLDEKLLEQCYAFAYTHYNAGQYEEALSIFEFLIKLSPTTYKYLLGAGACFYQMKDFATAKVLFCGAAVTEPTNPYPLYYLAECFLKHGELDDALGILDWAVELADQDSQYAKLGQRCLLLRNNLLNS